MMLATSASGDKASRGLGGGGENEDFGKYPVALPILWVCDRCVLLAAGDLLPGNSHVVGLGPFGENGHEAEVI